MKKIVILLLASIPWLFNPLMATEKETGYIGLQIGEMEGDDGFIQVETDYQLIRIGYAFSENTAFEYRLGRGNSDDIEGGVRRELEDIYGLYGLYHFNFLENASVYGVLGFSDATYKLSNAVDSTQVDDSGLSYGVGVQFYGFNLEYMQYLDTSDLDVDGYSIGYNYYF